ncbi:hypothetical protein CDL12_23689 [Handroanthus impetiginosus]|uniref:Uncharacterized protein n=1 Tax=Handroanthus impetiginosus TaxID=429701 RepID=A0A2G9GEZ2_9LAMI|nr:hypothetical protein CDL12_23689 [Handroanthus impetiginosus]
MDMKALAKSKRAHSLHHSKKHQPHQASKSPTINPGDKKPTAKQAKEKAPHSHGSRPLPSNWDRYDADLDLSSEDTALASSSQPTEVVAPKSKGADYAYLISEAKAQSQSKYSSDMLPSFNDAIPDFTQDFGPMLAAKGQSILSWIADDNFEFEGKASTSIKVIFFQLDDESQARGEDKDDPQPCMSAVAMDSGVSSSLVHNQEDHENVQQYRESSSSSIAITGNFPVQSSEEGLKPIEQIEDEILQSERTSRSISTNPIFEAASAEVELDRLLNSFAESNILDTSSATSVETKKKGTHMMKPAVKIDDDIDDLLEETSDGRRMSYEVKASADDASSKVQTSSKSKLLDDFDSWLDTI